MKKKRKSRLLRIFLLLSVLFIFCSVLYVAYLDQQVIKKFEGQRWKLPSKIYSSPFLLSHGLNIEKGGVVSRLKRLNYHPVKRPVRKSGEYYLTEGVLEIYLHEFAYPDRLQQGVPISLSLSGKEIDRLVDLSLAEDLEQVPIEPEVIGGFYEGTWEERSLVRLSEVPPVLIDAIVAMEDHRFYEHGGIDPRGILRAAWANLRARSIVQGGSTLTQQLVKNFYLDGERTMNRKVNEAIMSLLLERHYSKEEILETYLNEIYLGQNGIMGIYGVGQGSWFYFGKPPHEMTVGESALLAGMIRSPNSLSPMKNLKKAIQRRNLVLESLFAAQKISLRQYIQARAEAVSGRRVKERLNAAPYFVDEIRQRLAAAYPGDLLNSGGLRIFTALDVDLQKVAEEKLRDGLQALERQYPHLKRGEPERQLQGALVAVDPRTGEIRALVGGRDYGTSQFNRVTQARRQPGSLFKPFVYLAAFEQAANGREPYTPISQVEDAPITLQAGGRDWSPQNYDKNYLGPVTLRAALERSLNAATVRLSQQVGIEKIVGTARALGVTSPLKELPSLALGTSEVSPLEMAVAYAALANQGVKREPLFVEGISDPANLRVDAADTNEAEGVPPSAGVSPQAAFLVTHLMKGVIESGTGQGVRKLGFDRPAAAKTGTTSDERDAWFAGYTPDLVTVVWVGFDQNDPVELTGAAAALPIWTAFMKEAVAAKRPTDFIPPTGIVFKRVNENGKLCSSGREEAFIEGTEPTESCERGILRWFEKLFF
ncbi:MAG: PBP1A family penicillin-binding protein [Nitrospirae bacterium]|nr:PBP1A family penicillin-binding protein [Candidatus Manganitrophaceae bacterium]